MHALPILVVDAEAGLVEDLIRVGLPARPVADERAGRAALAAGAARALLLSPEAASRQRAAEQRLAHDLRGELALVRGHAELLATSAGPGPEGRALQAIIAAVTRMAGLLERGA